MKYLNGKCYVEVKDKRYEFEPFKGFVFELPEEPKSLRTQYRVQIEREIGEKRKSIK